MRLLAIALGAILSFATPLFALGATIEPSSSDLSVTPGQTAVATIHVQNDAHFLMNYEVTVVEAVFGDLADDLSFSPLSASLREAVKITPQLFSLDPLTGRTIDVLITLPVGTLSKSPTLAVLVAERSEEVTGGGAVQASLASLVFLHVSGGLERAYMLDSFTALPSFTLGTETMLSALFSNDGQQTVIIPNDIRVYGPLGREIGRGAFFSDLKHLPPGTTRGVTLNWPAESEFSPWLLGRYRFELWDGNRLLGETRVTFLPTKFLVVASVAIGCLLLGIIGLVRRRT